MGDLMQYLFYGKSGTGKSALATALLVPFLRNDSEAHMDKNELLEFLRISPRDRLKMCHARIKRLNAIREKKFEFPKHTVQSNEALWVKKYGKLIRNYNMPGDKNGMYDENYETYCPPPCSIIRWDEAQKDIPGKNDQQLPPRVAFETQTHRKWGLDMLFFSQRATILNLNVRDNATIIEIESMQHKYNKYGFIISTTWKLKVFTTLKALDCYLATNKKTYKSTSYTFEGNIFDHYNSEEGEEHYIHHADKCGLNLRQRPVLGDSKEDIEAYVQENPYTPGVSYAKLSKRELLYREKKKQTEQKKEIA